MFGGKKNSWVGVLVQEGCGSEGKRAANEPALEGQGHTSVGAVQVHRKVILVK